MKRRRRRNPGGGIVCLFLLGALGWGGYRVWAAKRAGVPVKLALTTPFAPMDTLRAFLASPQGKRYLEMEG